MAMDDQILFTGKEINYEIPKMTELNSAVDRLREKVEKKEDLALKYQDELRKNLNVPMEAFVSEFARKQQYEAVKAFQDKWTKIAKERGNKLTTDDLMEMEKDRTAITGLQNEWKSSEALWKQDQAMIKQSPGDFDKDKFAADTHSFLSSGQYMPNSLEYSGIDMASFFDSRNFEGSKYDDTEVVPGEDGYDTYIRKYGNATEKEAKDYIVQNILSDNTGRALKGVIHDFSKETPTEKAKWLKDYDTDNSGTISDAEMASANVKWGNKNILESPFILYAQDKYLKNVLKTGGSSQAKRRPAPPVTGATVTTSINKEGEVSTSYTKKNVPDGELPKPPVTLSPEDEAAAAAEKAEARKAAEINDVGVYTIPAISQAGTRTDFMNAKGKPDKVRLPGLVEKSSSVELKAFDPEKKTFTVYPGGKGGTAITIDLKYVEGWPEDIKNKIFSAKIKTPDGKIKTIAAFLGKESEAGAASDASGNEYWNKYERPTK